MKQTMTALFLALTIGASAQQAMPVNQKDTADATKVYDYSKELNKDVDEFTKDVIIRTPYEKSISFIKYIKSGKEAVLFSPSIRFSNYESGAAGVYVMFTDGSTWQRPDQKIPVNRMTKNWDYTCMIQLTPTDTELFRTKTVK